MGIGDTIIKANPFLVGYALIFILAFISLVASNGAAHLVAAGILEIVPVILQVLVTSNTVPPRPIVINGLLFLYFAGAIGALAAIIVSAALGGALWPICHTVILITILVCGGRVVYQYKTRKGSTSVVSGGSQPGVASVHEAVLNEGEATIVYHYEGDAAINKGGDLWKNFTSYRILYGPGKFALKANEWCHYFNWTHPWSRLTRYPPVGHVLLTLEDHIYAKIDGLRTTDNQAIYLDVYIFFRLTDIDKLVKTNMDPIFSFRGVAREDIFRFVATKSLNEFIQERRTLCDLRAVPQLTKYAESIGFTITRVTCIDYKDKPKAWKLTTNKHGSQGNRKRATNQTDPHAYGK